MANPLINLGVITRLRGAIIVPNAPQLNVTAQFLTKAGIRWQPEGDTTLMLGAMAGMVQSQEVYLKGNLLVGLVKTAPLAALYLAKIQSDSNLGNVTFLSDASNIPNIEMTNCAVEGIEGIDSSGTSADFPIRISGTFYVNNNLWNS